MSRFSLFLTASLTASLWTIPARAATTCVPTPVAPCPSDIFQVTDGNGHIINDISGKPASAMINEGDPAEGVAAVAFDFAVPPPPGSLPITLGLTETTPNTTPGLTPLSDVVELKSITTPLGPPGVELLFASDSETTSASVDCTTGFVCIAETGQPQDVTALLFPGVTTPPFHVIVQSDISEVPEPGTMLLLASGVAGLTVMGARRQRV